jgi:beta-lactam-binding protein with PASTA domain
VATVLMPDVRGLKLPEAKALIRSGLFPRADIIVRYVRASQPAGVVIAQTPAPGVRVAVNGRITLRVSGAS